MTHSPDHAERVAQQMLAARGRFPSGGDVPFDVALSLIAAALRGRDRVVEAAQFLSDRLDDLEWMDGELESTCRDYMGHVDPAHARLRAALHDAKEAGE